MDAIVAAVGADRGGAGIALGAQRLVALADDEALLLGHEGQVGDGPEAVGNVVRHVVAPAFRFSAR